MGIGRGYRCLQAGRLRYGVFFHGRKEGRVLDLEFEELERRWERLTPRERAVILVAAGVRDAFPAGHGALKGKRR